MAIAVASQVRLKAVVRHGEDWSAVRLSGIIDEHNGLRDLTDRMKNKLLLIDLSGIRRINSVGVRDWVHWLGDLRRKDFRVVMFDCPPSIMDQVNLVRNFSQGATVFTFYAPYYCDRCDKEEDQRLDAFELLRSGSRVAPAFPCGKPACPNALDDVEENYFAFLDDQKLPQDVDKLSEVVNAARSALDAGQAEALVSTGGDASGQKLAAVGRTSKGDGSQASQLVKNLAKGGAEGGEIKKGGDFVFVGVLLVMLALLGVIVYLIMTLE